MNECKSGSCGIGASREKDTSSESRSTCGCTNSEGTCGCCGDGKPGKFLFLANAAHHELLKQKMKAAFEAKIGKKMDKVADAVVTAALAYMQDRMQEEDAHERLEKKLLDIFKG